LDIYQIKTESKWIGFVFFNFIKSKLKINEPSKGLANYITSLYDIQRAPWQLT
jgi:hypothetical protein